MSDHYDINKYKHPGSGWYVLRNGHICYSGSLKECKEFLRGYLEKAKQITHAVRVS